MSKNTRANIMNTFLRLLNIKPLEKITITEIIKKTHISRNTFYYYFDDIFDLVKQVFEYAADNFIEESSEEDTLAEKLEFLYIELKKNRTALRHIYTTDHHLLVGRYIQDVLDKIFFDFFKNAYQGVDANDEQIQFISRYHRYAVQGFITNWLANDNNEDLEKLLMQGASLSEAAIHESITESVDRLKLLNESND